MASLITPAAALDGREAYAFLVATYEKTADQCNYATDVRASMAQIDSQFAKADKDTWTGLKLRGRTALTDLETILPLNVDWSSCTSVGELLTTWASIAAVTSIMEMDDTPIDIGMGTTPDPDDDAAAQDIAAMINEETAIAAAQAKASKPWTITPLASEVQGGCLLTIPLDADTDFIAVSRPGDLMQAYGSTTSRCASIPRSPITGTSCGSIGRTPPTWALRHSSCRPAAWRSPSTAAPSTCCSMGSPTPGTS